MSADDVNRAELLAYATKQGREFERELLAAKLEFELLDVISTADADGLAYRKGWNARARSVIEQLRGGR